MIGSSDTSLASRFKILIEFRERAWETRRYYDGTMESVVLNGNVITYYREIGSEEREKLGLYNSTLIIANEFYEEAQEISRTTPPPHMITKTYKGLRDFYYAINNFLSQLWIVCCFLLFFAIYGGFIFILPIVIFLVIVVIPFLSSKKPSS